MITSERTSSISFRVNSKVKAEAENLFEELGLTTTTALNIFMRQAVREGRIPFSVTTNSPNARLESAMKEADELLKDPNTPTYSAEEAIKELMK